MENLKVNTLKPLRKRSPKCEDFKGSLTGGGCLREFDAVRNHLFYGR